MRRALARRQAGLSLLAREREHACSGEPASGLGVLDATSRAWRSLPVSVSPAMHRSPWTVDIYLPEGRARQSSRRDRRGDNGGRRCGSKRHGARTLICDVGLRSPGLQFQPLRAAFAPSGATGPASPRPCDFAQGDPGPCDFAQGDRHVARANPTDALAAGASPPPPPAAPTPCPPRAPRARRRRAGTGSFAAGRHAYTAW